MSALDDALRQLIEDVVRRVVREELFLAMTKMGNDQSDDMLTISNAAVIATVSVNTVRSWLNRGLQANRIGRVVRIRRQHLVDFLKQMPAHTGIDPNVHATEILSRRKRKE